MADNFEAKDQLRNFCFTINNYTENESSELEEWDQVSYLVIGKEVGEKCGTPHLQGYCELKAPKKFKTIKKIIPRARIERRKKTAQQAADYCKKDGDYIEKGSLSQQGKRKDIDLVADMVREKRSLKEIATAAPSTYIKYHKGIKELKSVLQEPRNEVPKVTVLYGPTGVGKSRTAREITKDDRYVWGPEQGMWFDGYDAHTDVIFEEFRGQLPFGMMLRLLDRYDCKVQYKGGMTQFVGINIVITSPMHPVQWYENMGSDKIDQLMRRINEIKMLVKGIH